MLSLRGQLPPIAFNGSGRAPSSLDPKAVTNVEGKSIGRCSPHSVTIPGAVDAWARLVADYGRKTLGYLLQPAIRFAEEGYPVHQRVYFDWRLESDVLLRHPITREVFLPHDKVPKPGEMHKQPKLAKTLKLIAEKGRSGFYEGEIARDMVDCLQSLGGYHSLEDFEQASGDYFYPISTTYRGHVVYECPPNTQGIAALQILNILSTFSDDDPPLSARRLHTEIEAVRLAYEDADNLLSDPSTNNIDISRLLSSEHASRLASQIDQERRRSQGRKVEDVSRSTVYISVVDKDRNAVSFINSIFDSFGSGITAPESGVLFNNRATAFSLDLLHPNGLAPRKRPRHTLIPAILGRNGKTCASFGVMGGSYQAAGHAYFLRNLLGFGLDVQESIDLPRVFPAHGNRLDVERGIPNQTRAELKSLGHELCRPVEPIGGAQAILIDWDTGVLTGGSDSRKDGCALGY
jgi:gamma-glutamyltranspeptidase/glutathione hydrolase